MAQPTLTILSEVASVCTFVVLMVGIGHARRQAYALLEAHCAMLEMWACGPNGSGWADEDVKRGTRLRWLHPGFNVLGQYSGSAIAEVALMQNVFLEPRLGVYIANVVQVVNGLNEAVSQVQAFKRASPTMAIVVSKKLNAAIQEVLGSTHEPPTDLSSEAYQAVLVKANFTEEQWDWAKALQQMVAVVHLAHIGTRKSQGLHFHVAELRQALRELG